MYKANIKEMEKGTFAQTFAHLRTFQPADAVYIKNSFIYAIDRRLALEKAINMKLKLTFA